MNREQTERRICAAICQSNGLKAKDIARQLNLDRSTVNRVLYASPLLKDLCYQDDDYRWHGIIRQSVPHDGLYEFSGYYAKVSDFLKLTEDEWMDELTKGCQRIGRNLNDTRGLLHSFRDCREQMINLFADLQDMLGNACLDWEIVFEFRLKRARYVRIYADVLVITENKVFSLEFKMKDKIDTEEISQAAKYVFPLWCLPRRRTILILPQSAEAILFSPFARAICFLTYLTSIWDFCRTEINNDLESVIS